MCECLQVFAVIEGVPLNKITVPQGAAFQHQFTPAAPEGTEGIINNETNKSVSGAHVRWGREDHRVFFSDCQVWCRKKGGLMQGWESKC